MWNASSPTEAEARQFFICLHGSTTFFALEEKKACSFETNCVVYIYVCCVKKFLLRNSWPLNIRFLIYVTFMFQLGMLLFTEKKNTNLVNRKFLSTEETQVQYWHKMKLKYNRCLSVKNEDHHWILCTEESFHNVTPWCFYKYLSSHMYLITAIEAEYSLQW